jgi:prefoldin subunit 5
MPRLEMNIVNLTFDQARSVAEIVREKIRVIAKQSEAIESELASLRNKSATLEAIAQALESQTGGEAGAMLELSDIDKE